MTDNSVYKDFFSAINDIPYIGVLIYQEKIVYVNNVVVELTGYTLEELYRKSVLDLLPKSHVKEAEYFFKKRLAGENFIRDYFELPIAKKDGGELTCLTFSASVNYQGKPSGLLIAIDITKQKFLEKNQLVIEKINNLISVCEDSREFMEKLCEILRDVYNNDLIYLGKLLPENFLVEPLCGEGKKIPLKVLGDIEVVTEKFEKDEIIVKSDIKGINLGSFEFKGSCCGIPIKTDDNMQYALIMFSSFADFFAGAEIDFMSKLQKLIEFGLDKIEKENNIKILYKALENSPDWVLITDKNGTIVYVNKTVEKLTGYTREELIGNNPNVLKSGYYDRDFYDKMWASLRSGEPFGCVIINKDKYGNLFKVEHLIIPVKVRDEISHFVALGKDMSREEKLEGEVYKLKFHDVLTGVLNRYGFIFEIGNKIKSISEKESGLLVIIDICNFSHINKIFSEDVGNSILIEVARLLENTNPGSIIARTGGDEFSFFVTMEEDNIIKFIISIIDLFRISKFSSNNISVAVNIGVAIYPRDTTDINELINNAKSSLNIAKKAGENRFALFNQEIEKRIKSEREVTELIISALENDWFEVYLQPYFFTNDLSLAGFEALLRIKHPERGVLTPFHFIDVLEESEFIFEVEKRIINKLSMVIRSWMKKNYSCKPISFNMTGKSFKNENIIEHLKTTVKALPREMLNLEITERLLLEDPEYSKNIIKDLQDYGIKISLDDFGTGYSSLSYITEIPVDYLKIDISFVRKLLQSQKTYAIVETIINLSKKLDMATIAEGVETKEQYKELKKLGCNIVQGFLFAKPCPISEAEKYNLQSVQI